MTGVSIVLFLIAGLRGPVSAVSFPWYSLQIILEFNVLCLIFQKNLPPGSRLSIAGWMGGGSLLIIGMMGIDQWLGSFPLGVQLMESGLLILLAIHFGISRFRAGKLQFPAKDFVLWLVLGLFVYGFGTAIFSALLYGFTDQELGGMGHLVFSVPLFGCFAAALCCTDKRRPA